MLRYIAYGQRRYRQRPVQPCLRERWELTVAVEGCVAPLIPGRSVAPAHRRLWLLPPHLGHGWTGDDQEAKVVTLSPLRVPLAVERAAIRAAAGGGLLHWDLDDGAAQWLCREVEALIPGYAQPGAVDLLRQERLVLEVCIRALAAQPASIVEPPSDDPRRQVDAATAWFANHLRDGCGAIEAAQAIHVSPAHLRRLFHRVLRASPRTVFERIRLQRADQMLVGSSLPLDEIAAACGYSSASTFCRAYHRQRGRSPGSTRAMPNRLSA